MKMTLHWFQAVSYTHLDAIDKAFEISKEDDVISAFGSLYFVGEVRNLLGVGDY